MAEGILGYEEMGMSQSVRVHTTGSWQTSGNITVTSTLSTQGQATLPISFTGTGSTWKRGDVFTIASVFAVNPQTRETTGSLQQFVVTEDLTATTTGTLKISPAIYTSASALATVNSFPQASAIVTMVGTASSQSAQNLIYHKDSISFATADLLLPQGVDMASRQVHNGISMRIVRQYDINNDRLPCRIDVLYGYSTIRPAMAARLQG
jgi:hypothetical protein